MRVRLQQQSIRASNMSIFAAEVRRDILYHQLLQDWTNFISQVHQVNHAIAIGAMLVSRLQDGDSQYWDHSIRPTLLQYSEYAARCVQIMIEERYETFDLDTDYCVMLLLNRFMFDMEKFSGHGLNYYDVTNAFVDDVIERKQGAPLALSAVCNHLYLNVHHSDFI